jgi:hypothetical protein
MHSVGEDAEAKKRGMHESNLGLDARVWPVGRRLRTGAAQTGFRRRHAHEHERSGRVSDEGGGARQLGLVAATARRGVSSPCTRRRNSQERGGSARHATLSARGSGCGAGFPASGRCLRVHAGNADRRAAHPAPLSAAAANRARQRRLDREREEQIHANASLRRLQRALMRTAGRSPAADERVVSVGTCDDRLGLGISARRSRSSASRCNPRARGGVSRRTGRSQRR